MPPKKKGNKKAQDDDWEAELGETIAPQNGAEEPKAEDTPAADDDTAGGGLMAALQRRSKKKKNKGADFELEGEDPTADRDEGADAGFGSKAPQEATFDDDDDDVFAGNYGKKKAKGGAAAEKQDEPKDEPADDGAPRVKTKAEKEKEKKEKEKQRKKELVCLWTLKPSTNYMRLTDDHRLRRKKRVALRRPLSQQRPLSPNPNPLPRPLLPHPSLQLLRVARRRNLTLRSPLSRNNRKRGRRGRRSWLVLRQRRRLASKQRRSWPRRK